MNICQTIVSIDAIATSSPESNTYSCGHYRPVIPPYSPCNYHSGNEAQGYDWECDGSEYYGRSHDLGTSRWLWNTIANGGLEDR